MAEQSSEALQNQIAELERQLAEKRVESGGDTALPYERAEVHAVVGEKIQQASPSYQAPLPAASSNQSLPSWQNPVLADSVQILVNVAFTQSLQQAINDAVGTKNAALIDAFHDLIVDQLHQELLNRQKMPPAP